MNFLFNFKLTLRSLIRNKQYVSINLISFAIGLMCCIFIFQYVRFELSYDTFHHNSEQIYRLETTIYGEGVETRYANLASAKHIVDAIEKLPEVENQSLFAKYGAVNIEVEEELFAEFNGIAADAAFLEIFSFELLNGDSEQLLAKPNSLVITNSTAQKYFGSTDAIGQSLIFNFQDKKEVLTVVGVLKDIPQNSHFYFDFVTSEDVFQKMYEYEINEVSLAYFYMKLSSNVLPNKTEEKIQHSYLEGPSGEFGNKMFHLRPILDIHLNSSSRGELSVNNKSFFVYIFVLVAFIILGLGCFNFVTLATAKSIQRAKEIGIRKALGAGRLTLASSFLVESILLTVAGLAVGYLLVWYGIPYFNEISNKQFGFSEFVHPNSMLLMLGAVLLMGLISGIYPALVLSHHKITLLLKNVSKGDSSGSLLWRSMVITQFSITLILFSITSVVQNQINYIYEKDLGFNKEQVITIQNYLKGDKLQEFKELLTKNSAISTVSSSSYVPGVSNTSGVAQVQIEGSDSKYSFSWVAIDPNYFSLYGIEVKSGRNITSEFSSDSLNSFLINKTAVDVLGWDEPIGKQLNSFGKDGYVVGVVDDFNFLSLYHDIPPMIFVVEPELNFQTSIKIGTSEDINISLSYIENVWKEFIPGTAFTYQFVDDQYESLYKSERKAKTLFSVFSMLAVFISILGLVGFTSYIVQKKRKEIGIRKVLGASIKDVLLLFYSGYAKLFLVSLIISLPLIYISVKEWIKSFSFHLEISPFLFFIPTVIVSIVFLVTITMFVVKNASENPVNAIKNNL